MDINHLINSFGLSIDLSEHILCTTFRVYLEGRFDEYKEQRRDDAKIGTFNDNIAFSNKSEIRERDNEYKALAEAKEQLLWLKKTSGTTGKRTNIYYDSAFYFEQLYLTIRKIAFSQEIELDAPGACIVSIMGNMGSDDEVFIDPCVDGLFHIRLSVDERYIDSVKSFVNKLSGINPRIIAIKPSLCLALISRIKTLDLDVSAISPDLIISSGQYLSDRAKANICDFFGCLVVNAYIVSEAGLVAAERKGGEGLFVDQSSVMLHQNPCVSNDIYITSNCNKIMPLRHYAIGDSGKLLTHYAGGQIVMLGKGRNVPIFELSNGFVVDPTRFDHVAFEVIKAEDYSIMADRGNIIINLLSPGVSSEYVKRIAEEFFGPDLNIEIQDTLLPIQTSGQRYEFVR